MCMYGVTDLNPLSVQYPEFFWAYWYSTGTETLITKVLASADRQTDKSYGSI